MRRAKPYPAKKADPANTLGAIALAVTDGMFAAILDANAPHRGDTAALNAIGFRPACSVRELADLLNLSHPGAVRCVDRLVAAGFVDRASGRDARKVALRLTSAGTKTWKVLRDKRMKWLNRLVKILPDADRQALAMIVSRLLESLAVDEAGGERICRLCDESICVPSRCPITDILVKDRPYS